jgi:hypothetical protein
VEDFFFFLLAVVCWSLRLYFAALADCTAARGDEVWNGRRKGAGAVVRVAERKRVVGDAFVRHEGQYRVAAMVAVYEMCSRPLSAIRYALRCRSRRRRRGLLAAWGPCPTHFSTLPMLGCLCYIAQSMVSITSIGFSVHALIFGMAKPY